jgi:hypothetical protein
MHTMTNCEIKLVETFLASMHEGFTTDVTRVNADSLEVTRVT